MNSPWQQPAGGNWGPAPGDAELYASIGRNLASGISSAGDSIASKIDEYKKTQAAGKAADYFKKSQDPAMVPMGADDDPSQAPPTPPNPFLAKLGIHEEQWKIMGARDKAQAAQAFMQAQGYDQAQQEIKQRALASGDAHDIAISRLAQIGAEQKRQQELDVKNEEYDKQGSAFVSLLGTQQDPEDVNHDVPPEKLYPLAGRDRNLGEKIKARQAALALQNGVDPTLPFYNTTDKGRALRVQGADEYSVVPTGPNTGQVIFRGGPTGGSVNVPGVGNVGVITTKPGQSTIIPGQVTEAQLKEKLRTAEAALAHSQATLKEHPEFGEFYNGAVEQQKSLIESYRQQLGTSAPPSGPKTDPIGLFK